MKSRIITIAAIIGLMATACNKENELPQQGELIQTPITISANYENNSSKVSYSESGNSISAKWEAGDELLVCYDGQVSTLTLTGGAGEVSATFTGNISHTHELTANSMLVCYVKDRNAPNGAVTVSGTGTYTYSDGAFLGQDGTLAGAAKCNLYYGATFYGDGTNINCTFNVNTSMMKFDIFVPMGHAGTTKTLSYMSDEAELARATFTVGDYGMNTIYMAIPAGHYEGSQNLRYDNNSYTLSSTQANFVAGQTYCKKAFYDVTLIDLATLNGRGEITLENGDVVIGTQQGNAVLTNSWKKISIADGATVIISDITIPDGNGTRYQFAGINCNGDATIVLHGTNNVGAPTQNYPAIYIPTRHTLTIDGKGSLTANSGAYVNGSGSGLSAGIGGSSSVDCGNIDIKGGSITANGMNGSPGIGGGLEHACGNITIRNTVTSVTATKGSQATNSIGASNGGTCGTVTIGGTVTGNISTSPYTYQP